MIYKMVLSFLVLIGLQIFSVDGLEADNLPNQLKCKTLNNPQTMKDISGVDIGNELAKLIGENNFQLVIEAAELWKSEECLLANGKTRITYWLSGFTKYFNETKNWEESLEKIQLFQSLYPDNVLPLLAEARYWSDYANNARGFGYSSSVTEEGWILFNERLKESEKILLNNYTEGSNWPQWYWQMIRVQSLLGKSVEERNVYFFEGSSKFKNENAIYSEMSYYREPRWGGTWDEVEEIISYAMINYTRESPQIIYTKNYWERGKLMNPKRDLFLKSKVSWKKMRNGFIEMMAVYPESTLIENSFLSFACIQGDKSTYLKYRSYLTIIDHRGFEGDVSIEACDEYYGYNADCFGFLTPLMKYFAIPCGYFQNLLTF